MKKILCNINNKGSSDAETIIVLAVLGGIIMLILWIFGFNFGIENEGEVKYNDCRQVITLKNDSWQKYFHKFTCSTLKSKSGKTMGGECASVETANSLFSSSSDCLKAYIFEKDTNGGICTDPTHPYLTYDDTCSTTQYPY